MTKLQIPNIETLEASLYLKITVKALTQLAISGKIAYIQIGRNRLFSKEALLIFKNANKA